MEWILNLKKNDILEVKHLSKYFQVSKGLFRKHSYIKAVDDVSFTIRKGETLGLVGESGCGKTTIGRTILKLYTATAGKILFDGQDISNLNEREMIPFRRKMQMILIGMKQSFTSCWQTVSLTEIHQTIQFQ